MKEKFITEGSVIMENLKDNNGRRNLNKVVPYGITDLNVVEDKPEEFKRKLDELIRTTTSSTTINFIENINILQSEIIDYKIIVEDMGYDKLEKQDDKFEIKIKIKDKIGREKFIEFETTRVPYYIFDNKETTEQKQKQINNMTMKEKRIFSETLMNYSEQITPLKDYMLIFNLMVIREKLNKNDEDKETLEKLELLINYINKIKYNKSIKKITKLIKLPIEKIGEKLKTIKDIIEDVYEENKTKLRKENINKIKL